MTKRTTPRLQLLATALLVALLAVACGTGVTEITADRDGVNMAPLEQQVDGSPASDAAPGAGHQYGSTIEQWSEVKRQQDPDDEYGNIPANPADPAAQQSEDPTVTWDDLIPAGSSGEEIVERYQDRLDAVEPGTAEATALYAEMQAEFNPDAVNPALDGQGIRLAGFVAPLTYEDELVTEFLLVPTFGACIHVPPPPPNQTVMVKLEDGLTLEESWGAVWVEGTMTVQASTTDLASASYEIVTATSGAYEDF